MRHPLLLSAAALCPQAGSHTPPAFAFAVLSVCPDCRAVNVISMIKTSTQIKRKRSRLTGPPAPRALSLSPFFQPDPLCGGSIIHRRTCSQQCLSGSASTLTTLFFFNENINSNVSLSLSDSNSLSLSPCCSRFSFFTPSFSICQHCLCFLFDVACNKFLISLN